MGLKVSVAGGRGFADEALFNTVMDDIKKKKGT